MIGTFGEQTGLRSDDECTPCTAGSYCAQTGLTTVEGDCAAGYYCPSGSEACTFFGFVGGRGPAAVVEFALSFSSRFGGENIHVGNAAKILAGAPGLLMDGGFSWVQSGRMFLEV